MGLVVLPGHALQSENTFVRSKCLELFKRCVSLSYCEGIKIKPKMQFLLLLCKYTLFKYVSFAHWKDIIRAVK